MSRSIGQTAIATITLTGTIPSNFRIGIVTDVSSSIWDVPGELQIKSSNGDVSALSCVALGNLTPDVYFFNVSGAHAGDVLTIYVTFGGAIPWGASYNYPTIGGLVFDTSASAPPSLASVLTGATQTLFDDFTGTSLNGAVWSKGMRYGHINNELQGYNPGNVTVANGLCSIQVKKEQVGNIDMTGTPTGGTYSYSSGCLQTYSKWTQTYGYYEAKIRCATGKGTWPAFWLLPDRGAASPNLYYRTAVGNNWSDGTNSGACPMGNEVDVLEYMQTWKNPSTGFSEGHAGSIWEYNTLGASFGDFTDVNMLASPDTQFHTYGVLWKPGSLDYYIDGNIVMSAASPNIAVCPEYLILNCAVSTDDWKNTGPSTTDIDATLPATMDIDYVKVYSLPSGSGPVAVNVANSGFETGDLTNWSTVASGGYGSGAAAVNNALDQSNTYPSFSAPLPGTAAGTFYAAIAGYENNPAEIIYQDVSANGLGNAALQPNTTYTLTVAIGVGRYSSLNNGYISLVNGTGPTGTVLNTSYVSSLGFSQYANNFKDLTVTFTTGSTVSGHLTLVIGTPHGYPSATFMAVDNVRLTKQVH